MDSSSQNGGEERVNFDPSRALYATTPAETSNLANELPSANHECAKPESNVESSCTKKPNCEFNVSGADIFPAKVIQDGPKEARHSPENQINIQGIQVEHSKESCTQHQETTRKLSLVSEMSGSHYRKLLSDPATGTDSTTVKRQNLKCRRHIISSPSTTSSLSPDILSLNPPLTSEVAKRACEVPKDDGEQNKNACENSTFDESIEFPQSSLGKKRKKSDSIGETDSCKRCSCKRSKCLKLYCECFATGVYCSGRCNCQDCVNKPDHEIIVLEARRQIQSRKPLAFAPKVIMCSDTPNIGNELYKTPVSARYEKGCHCKKSGCRKKYCECFLRGVGCSLNCQCESCKNTFGQKEGVVFEETKVLKECRSNVSSHNGDPQTDHEFLAARENSNNSRKEYSRETNDMSKIAIGNDALKLYGEVNSNEKQVLSDVMSNKKKKEVPMGMDQGGNQYVDMNDEIEIIQESGGSSKRSRTNEDGDNSILPCFETPTSATASRISRLQGWDASKEKLGKEKVSVPSHNSECTNEYCAMRMTREKELEIMEKNRKQMVDLEKHKGYVTLLNTLLAKTHLSPQEEAMKNDLIKIVMGKSF